MEKISEHVSYGEVVKSYEAKKHGIDNTPDENQLQNIKVLMVRLFEPLRAMLGNRPIFLSSVFRSKGLNRFLGGAKNSQHTAPKDNGSALDADDDGLDGYPTNNEIFWCIFDNLDFDQLIWEKGTNENPDWVHVSYVSPEKNRREVLYYNGEDYVEFKKENFIRQAA